MIQELNFIDSKRYLDTFYFKEKPSCSDWYEAEESNAQYIWKFANIDIPIGFLSYKVYQLPNTKEFLYIVKIFVLKEYRGESPILIENERVSQILFREIERKGINILTLESADIKLDGYYKKLDYKKNEEMNRIISPIIGKKRDIMVKIINREVEFSEEELKVLGRI